jgi:uncharacterized alpha-E superfamily protein
MSRYVERAENVSRFLQVNSNLMLDFPETESDQDQWQALVAATGDHEDFEKRYGEPSEKNVVRFLTFDLENPNSILSCLRMARENARTIRDTISSEMWQHLNASYLMVKKKSDMVRVRDLHSLYSKINAASQLFVGMSSTTMSHGEGWHFSRLGRILERADKTARILDVKYFILLPTAEYVDSPHDSVVWGALLKSASAFEMYRKKYNRIYYKHVTDFLVFDPEFPRSIHYCVKLATQSLDAIVAKNETTVAAVDELKKLDKMIAGTSIEEITQGGLHEFVDAFQFNLNIVGQEIHNSFFAIKS